MKFKNGDVVKPSFMGIKYGVFKSKKFYKYPPIKRGVILSDQKGCLVSVRWENRKSIGKYHEDFIDLVEEGP